MSSSNDARSPRVARAVLEDEGARSLADAPADLRALDPDEDEPELELDEAALVVEAAAVVPASAATLPLEGDDITSLIDCLSFDITGAT